MFQSFLQSICNEIRSLEIHIRHPKRDQFLFSEYLPERVSLDRPRTSSFYDLVKIVYFHIVYLLSESFNSETCFVLLKLTTITPAKTMMAANTFCHVSTSIPIAMLMTIAIMGWT